MKSHKDNLAVVHFPVFRDNPYNLLLKNALLLEGIEVTLKETSGKTMVSRLLWAWNEPLVHWHWIQQLYQAKTPLRIAVKLGCFTALLWALKLRGVKMVLTVHNLVPHKNHSISINKLGNFLLGKVCDRLLVHSFEAGEVVKQSYRNESKIRCVEHVDYSTYMPRKTIAKEARLILGIDDNVKMLLCFGELRAYKGVSQLLFTADELNKHGILLFIAGRPSTQEFAEELEAQAATSANVKLLLKRATDEELALLCSAADAAIFAHSDTLTSGAAHMALAYDLPIVCPRTTAFAELIRLGLAIPFEDLMDGEGVAEATAKAFTTNCPKMSEARAAYRAKCSLEAVGHKLKEIYMELLSP